MKKKILIASLFATVMFLVPIASVTGSSEITYIRREKTNVYAVEQKSASDKILIKLDRQLAVSSLVINIIKLRFSKNQAIVSQCKYIQSQLEYFKRGLFDVICESLRDTIILLEDLLIDLNEMAPWLGPFLVPILLAITSLANVYMILCE